MLKIKCICRANVFYTEADRIIKPASCYHELFYNNMKKKLKPLHSCNVYINERTQKSYSADQKYADTSLIASGTSMQFCNFQKQKLHTRVNRFFHPPTDNQINAHCETTLRSKV